MPVNPIIHVLKIKKDSATAEFIEWYEVYGAKPVKEGARRRKGDGKGAALMVLECLLNNTAEKRDDNSDQCTEILNAYKNKNKSQHYKDMQKAKTNLSDEEYKTFVELSKKANI